MHGGPIDTVLFVHGYSMTNLRTFNQIPNLLRTDGVSPDKMFLAGFVSLDDRVSCDDLAAGLEARISMLETSYGLDLSKTMLISHSTGAIVSRRWILNRRAMNAGGVAPKTLSHFMSCAGANHGSTMAQLGQTQLAYVFRNIAQGQSVGKRVLEDLDYGSAFLRRLNREWMDAWNDATAPLYKDTFCFSMGGTDHSFWQNHLTWQSREFGSDGTVRISGANLNYRWISVPGKASDYDLEMLNQPAPHLIVETPEKKYSHTSQDAPDTQNLVIGLVKDAATIVHGFNGETDDISSQTYGIVEGVFDSSEAPYEAIRKAMAIQDLDGYQSLAAQWASANVQWTQTNTEGANSTVIVAIKDRTGVVVDDSLVLLRDSGGTIGSVSKSLLANQPIHNGVTASVVSFYVNCGAFETGHPHSVHVQALTDTPYVSYGGTVDGDLSSGDDHVIAANEFTYVTVAMDRDPAGAFAFCQLSNPNLASLLQASFPPFSQPGWIYGRKEYLPKGGTRPPRRPDVALAAAGTGFDYPVTQVGVAGNVTVYYDPSLGAQGEALASGLLGRVVAPYDDVQGDFAVAGGPVNLVVAPLSGNNDGSGGAYHYGCDFTSGGTLYVDATFANTSENPLDLEVLLYVAELSECFMGTQGKGWNCGYSNGEALSRYYSEIETPPNTIPSDFVSGPSWAEAGYPDWISTTEQTDQDYVSIGCGIVYIYWMQSQGFTAAQITQAAGATFAANYQTLTGKTTAYQDLMAALAGKTVSSDNPF